MKHFATLLGALVVLASAGCTKSVREYHESAKTLRAVVEVEGLDNVPEPHKTALKEWAEKRDAAWRVPNNVVDAYKSLPDLKARVAYISGAIKDKL